MSAEEFFQQRIRLGRLLDAYGGLLTEKQRNFLQLYLYDDLSLGEISEEVGVWRQAVHDLLKRTEQTLERYEERLGHIEKNDFSKQQLFRVVQLLEIGRADETAEAIMIIRSMCGEDR